MSPLLLAFNIPAEKLSRLRFTCMRLGIQVRAVEPADYGQTLAALCGMAERTDAPAPEETFTDDMLLMANFTPKLVTELLSKLKQSRMPIRLKAVLTPTNVQWDPVQLHRSLSEEREAIARGQRHDHGEDAPDA